MGSGKLQGYEEISTNLNNQLQNGNSLTVANMDRIRNEAAAEFGRFGRLTDQISKRVDDNHDHAERRLSALSARRASPATRHVSPIGTAFLGQTPSPPQARELADWRALDERPPLAATQAVLGAPRQNVADRYAAPAAGQPAASVAPAAAAPPAPAPARREGGETGRPNLPQREPPSTPAQHRDRAGMEALWARPPDAWRHVPDGPPPSEVHPQGSGGEFSRNER